MKRLISIILTIGFVFGFLLYFYPEEYRNGGIEEIVDTLKNDVTNIRDNSVDEISGLLSSEDVSKKGRLKLTEPKTQTFNVANIEINNTKSHVLDSLGEEKRIVRNEYGYEWYIFHDDYENFVMVSFDKENHVNALFTNQDLIRSKDDIALGTKKDEVEKAYGTPLESIRKDNVNYLIDQEENFLVYKIDNNYVTFFFDSLKNNELQAIQIIHKDMEKKKQANYGIPSKELGKSFEETMFDVTNATRVKFELNSLEWDEESYLVAYNHSLDMAEKNYFSHNNLEGQTPFDRLNEAGITYRFAGENLAMGQSSGLFAHLGLLNSSGHRKNILKPEYKMMSVGVAFNKNDQPFYTEIYSRK